PAPKCAWRQRGSRGGWWWRRRAQCPPTLSVATAVLRESPGPDGWAGSGLRSLNLCPSCVSPEPKAVFAKEQPERSQVQAEAGASATLSCEVAQAQTEVTWYKDGKQLSPSSQVRVEAKGKQRRLVVAQAGRADAGEYSCEAGGQRVSFRLDVTGGCPGGMTSACPGGRVSPVSSCPA
uniref:Ig-like domain-containing protein n=1 Tax=Prolemur simus TaxID=1328070 RepID=A0A8C8ZVH9_PROSS